MSMKHSMFSLDVAIRAGFRFRGRYSCVFRRLLVWSCWFITGYSEHTLTL